MHVVVVSEHLGGRLDEGIRKLATSLIGGLARHADACGIATESAGESSSVSLAPGGKLFTRPALRDALAAARPDAVVYVPSAAGTLFSFMRARSLRRAVPGVAVGMVVTQMRPHTPPVRRLLRVLAPDVLFCQGPATLRYFERLGLRPWFLPSGVDAARFRPVAAGQRSVLRARLGLPQGEFLVLHAGHLKRGRNAGVLGKLEGIGRGVMLAGASMGLDADLKRELEGRGVIVIDRYLDRPEEVYQAADCYLFPVREPGSAIDFPLSVLEAMACNLPVVATPYGGLPLTLRAGDGLWFAESEDAMVRALRAVRAGSPAETHAQALAFTWERVAARLLEAMDVKDDAGAIAAAV